MFKARLESLRLKHLPEKGPLSGTRWPNGSRRSRRCWKFSMNFSEFFGGCNLCSLPTGFRRESAWPSWKSLLRLKRSGRRFAIALTAANSTAYTGGAPQLLVVRRATDLVERTKKLDLDLCTHYFCEKKNKTLNRKPFAL